jgi:chromosome condensin MukBEF ATPase and DNA-binding subunit MukB
MSLDVARALRYLNATELGVKEAFTKLEAKRRRARMKLA